MSRKLLIIKAMVTDYEINNRPLPVMEGMFFLRKREVNVIRSLNEITCFEKSWFSISDSLTAVNSCKRSKDHVDSSSHSSGLHALAELGILRVRTSIQVCGQSKRFFFKVVPDRLKEITRLLEPMAESNFDMHERQTVLLITLSQNYGRSIVLNDAPDLLGNCKLRGYMRNHDSITVVKLSKNTKNIMYIPTSKGIKLTNSWLEISSTLDRWQNEDLKTRPNIMKGQ